MKLAGDKKITLICTRFDLICESQTPFIRVISSADQSHGNTRFLRLTWECIQNIVLRSASKTQRDEVRHMLDIDPFIFKIYERIFIFLAKQRSFWYIYTLKAAWLLFGVDVWQNGGDECDLFEMRSHQRRFIWGDVRQWLLQKFGWENNWLGDDEEIKLNKYEII